jgi:biopolymer transport protein ExbD
MPTNLVSAPALAAAPCARRGYPRGVRPTILAAVVTAASLAAACNQATSAPGAGPPTSAPAAPRAGARPPAPAPVPAKAARPIVVAPRAAAAPCVSPDVNEVAVQVGRRGVWIGNEGGTRCFVARHGAIDGAAIQTEVGYLRDVFQPDCEGSGSVTAAPGIAYQDVVSAMDGLKAAGIAKIALGDAATRSIHFPAGEAAEKAAPAHCRAAAAAAPPPAPAHPRAGAPAGASRPMTPTIPLPSRPAPAAPDLADAPIAIITRTEVDVVIGGVHHRGGTVAELTAWKPAARKRLARALAAAPSPPSSHGGDRTIVIEADKDADYGVLNHVIETAKDAGFDNLLFAVKNK